MRAVVGIVRNQWDARHAGRMLVTAAAVVALAACAPRGSAEPKLDFGVSLAVASDGTVYVADRADSSVLALGQPLREVIEDPSLGPMTMIAVDEEGRLLIVGDRRVVRVAPDGTRETIADGVPEVRDVDVAPDGTVYVVGGMPARVIRIAPDGSRSEIAAPAGPGGTVPPVAGSPSPGARTGVSQAAVGADGTVSVLSEWRIWRLAPGAQPALVAGSLDPSAEVGNGDGGPAEHALLRNPYALAVTSAGHYFCDEAGRHVRHVDRTGVINTVVSLTLSQKCVDLAAVPGTSDLVLLDENGGVMRLSGDGASRQVLLRPRQSD